ncbi:MAG: alpha/beta hydrolase [Pseudomonadota bacterium]
MKNNSAKWEQHPDVRIVTQQLPQDLATRYLKYTPKSGRSDRPALVLVHGIARRARDHLREYLPWAIETGTTLLAPIFDSTRFRGYQRLGASNASLSAADALSALLDHETASGRAWLFGFSGGAQFAHRYCLIEPQRIDAAAIVAAGWYTMPTSALGFPYGLGRGQLPSRHRVQLGDFLQIPKVVLVGSLDTDHDESLRSNQRIDTWQGNNRLARATAWVAALDRASKRCGAASNTALTVLPNINHNWRRCYREGRLAERVTGFFDQTAHSRDSVSAISTAVSSPSITAVEMAR